MILPEGLVHRREMDHCVRVHTVLVQGPPEEEALNASTYAFSFPAVGILLLCSSIFLNMIPSPCLV